MLETHGLSCGFARQNTLAIGTLSFDKLTFVIGPNGSGKTTLLKTLAGLLPPQEGRVLLHKIDLNEASSKAVRPGFLPADSTIQYGVTGDDLHDIFETKNSKWFDPNILTSLDVKKHLSTPLEHLSSGEAQRVILSAVLAHPSPILILDEPMTHLDWSFAFRLHSVLQRMLDQKRTIVASVHEFNWILLFENSRTLALSQNRILVDDNSPIALTHTKVQHAFNFRSQLTDNPLSKQSLLALAAYERDRQ